MSEQFPEGGATRGIYMGWTDADLAASRAQEASMAAQRNFVDGSHAADTHYDGQPRTWTEATPAQREIFAAVEAGHITPEEAHLALEELAQS
ncbi:MAG TPA: hypothetical protein PLU21_04460 [Candidatus Saccharibacteria bacterium]|nr:hypothetical protein [Candidatus Saccharibacteria bacterium]